MNKVKRLRIRLIRNSYDRAEKHLQLALKDIRAVRKPPYRDIETGHLVIDRQHLFLVKDVLVILSDLRRHRMSQLDEPHNIPEVLKEARTAA